MRLLDLFCGAGGAAMGYHRAGFDEIVGVDIVPQKHYPFTFVQADALTYPLDGFDAIHASPPCQHYSVLRAMHPEREYADLIEILRRRLVRYVYVMENVIGSPLTPAPLLGMHSIVLCGTGFGLGARGMELRRHRWFESNVPLLPSWCDHRLKTIGVYGHGGHRGKHRMAHAAEARQALGIDWMNRQEMTQAIPPAYTEYIGRQLIRAIKARAAESNKVA